MASVARLHRSDKLHFLKQLDEDEVDRICGQMDHHFRAGKLSPGRTVRWFGWQILMGNVTCDAVRHRADGKFTASAYCQARQRLPLEVLEQVSHRIIQQAVARGAKEHRWRGHRTFLIDGSSSSLPDSKQVRDYFGISGNCKSGCGYPTAHLLVMVGAGGVGIDCICSPLRTGDMTHARRMHAYLQEGDVLIGDGLFSGIGHLYALGRQKLHGLFPLHHSRKVAWGRQAGRGPSRRFVRRLGWRDQLVEYRKPAQRPKWMTPKEFAAMPQWVLVREVQRQTTTGGMHRTVRLVTTLTDPKKYPAKALVRLLAERWDIEVNLRCLKSTMGCQCLHCQSVEGIRKELLMYLIVYNLVRLTMLEAAQRQKTPLSRISFADALMRLRYGSGGWVNLELNPQRQGRIEPRVVKRRPKPFAVMSKPRARLRQIILQQRRKHAA